MFGAKYSQYLSHCAVCYNLIALCQMIFGCLLYVKLKFKYEQLIFLSVTGTLKGYDQLLNLVLDEAVEFLRGKSFM